MAFRLIDMESWPRREFYEYVGDYAKIKSAPFGTQRNNP